MRSKFFVHVLAAVSLTLGACGGGGGDDDDGTAIDSSIDSPSADAGIDGSTALTGLGQPCVAAMQGADCPANANGCLTFTANATMGVCTKVCVQSATFMTNAQNQPGPLTPDPAAQNAMCTAIYTGTVGTAVCAVPVNRTPTGALAPNTTYTVVVTCGIQCGTGNTCPGNLTCNTGLGNICTPP